MPTYVCVLEGAAVTFSGNFAYILNDRSLTSMAGYNLKYTIHHLMFTCDLLGKIWMAVKPVIHYTPVYFKEKWHSKRSSHSIKKEVVDCRDYWGWRFQQICLSYGKIALSALEKMFINGNNIHEIPYTEFLQSSFWIGV